MKKINPVLRWWVTPKLPPEDIFAKHNFVSKWLTHPVKRRMARVYLKFLRKFGKIKVIGITGSTGKTTTTEILASILKENGKTVWSALGIDPVYNIPNTILRTKLSTKYLILEMSVEYFGEMDYYLWLATPDVGLITNVDATHLEYLKDVNGVLREKGKLLEAISKDGFALIHKNSSKIQSLEKSIKAKKIYFGQGSDIHASEVSLNKDLSTDFTLTIGKDTKSVHMNTYGYQFVKNAIAACATAVSLGIDQNKVVRGLEKYRNQAHRLNIFKSDKYGLIMDDTYNSNPKAARESLETFNDVSLGKKKIAVIGDMLELGRFDESAHRELGRFVSKANLSLFVGVGNSARFVVEEASKKMGQNKCYLVCNYKEALQIIESHLNKNTALFVKGSRSIHLDKLVEALQ